ncbi:MAG: hypothetical protein VB094_03010 [Oscillibacter sp.]|nr:hypothetical protein [Oscillibacter sp.]
MKKRILSILLCLCMVISLLPVTAQAADVDWSAMYASGSVIKPTPSDWTSGNNVAWAAADGGVKMSNAFSTASDRYFAAMLDIPDNAYYNLDFTLNGNSPVGAYMGYIVGNSVLGPSHAGYDNAWSWGVDMDSNDYKYYTGLDNGVTTANGTPKSWSLTGLRGTSVQFDYILVSGTDQSVDNYMVISGVKFTRLTNKVAVTPSGTGSGTFDVSSGADFNQTGTAMTSAYSADIGRGSQITLTAHPAAGSYFDHWEDSDGASISTDISITVTVGESAADTADRTFNPVFNSGTNPNVTKLLDGNARNELTGGNLCITHMGSSWSAPTWGILDALRSSIGSSTTDSDATLTMTLDVAAEDSVFYGLAVPGSSTKGNEAYMTVTVDGTLTAAVGGASSGNTSKPYSNSFAIPVTQGSHSVSFRLRDANSMAYLLGLGLVSGDNQTVTLKATDFDTLPGCASYTVTVNGIDVTTDVKSAAGYTAPYGSVAQFAAVNADGAKYVFQNWSTGDYSATSVIPDVDTVGMGQLILRGNATLTPVYTEGVNVASAIMADPAEKAPDGNDYQWTMNSASYFSINTDGAVAIAEGGALSLEFTVPEGQVYMSRIQGNCDFTLYKDNNKINDYDLFQPTGYCYSVLDTGSYKMVFTGSSTGILDNFTCQPYGSMGYGKVTIAASQPDKSDATQVLADSGALPAIEYIFNNIDSFGYVADGYTDKVVKCSSDLNFALDKTKLENAGLSALNADKADGSGTVSFNTNGTTLTIPFSNFLLSQDGSYSYRVHINLQSTGGYPYLLGTTLYANGCPIYVSDGGKVYFYNKTDGSYTEPVKNLSTGDAQITLGSGATIYGGSNKADVASTYVSLAYNTAAYTVYGGGNSGYGVTGSSAVVCPGGTVNMINGGNNGNGTKPASITVTGTSSKITATNGVTGGSATGDVTVAVLEFEGELTGGSSENGTVTVNAGTSSYSTTITGSVIGVPAGGTASNVVINVNAMATVSGGIFGAKLGSNVGNITVNVAGKAEGGAITGADNATVTGDVAVNVTAADLSDSTAIYGQFHSTVGGSVAVTVNGGNFFSCGGVNGSSGGSVTGKVTVKTNGKVSGKLQGVEGGSVGSVEVITDGDVSGGVTGLSGGSSGAVTVTTNYTVTDAVCAVRDGSVTGDVSLAVNAQAKSVAAVQAATKAVSVTGNVTLNMGQNASLTDNTITVLAPVSSASNDIKATVTGDVTFNHRMNTLAGTVTLSDRDEFSVVSGVSSLNAYKDNGQQIVLRGGNAGGAVNLYALYTKPVYVPLNGAAPAMDSSVTGGYFVKKTSDQSGFDLYSLVDLTKPIVDEVGKRIFGNGFSLKISSSGVSYLNGSDWVSIAAGDLSAYTVYGGAEQTDVSSASITFSGVSAQSPGTYFGGGKNGDVTGSITIKLEESNDFGRPVTIYGGAENADITGKLYVSLNYDVKNNNTNMVTWFAGCKNGDFHGSAQFDIQRNDTASETVYSFQLPGAFYLCSENGTFTGNINLYTGAINYRTDITGGIHDAYSTAGKSSGYNTIHLLSCTDSTATPITRTSEKTTVTGAGDVNFKSISWENGSAVLSYHVVLKMIDAYTTAAEITDTAENYILYAAGGLYCDRGTVGEEDSADVLVRGFAKQGLHYYFGTDKAKLPAGETLTLTMDSAAWVYFYMNGPLTLNLNTSLIGSGTNGVVIGDTAESVLLTIGRDDGGAESYTVNSSQMWYSKLVINKPFDSNYGIAIKNGNDYNEADITLNLDKSKYATEKNTSTFGDTYCRLKNVSIVVEEPTEDFIGRISGSGGKLEGYVLIFADGGKNYAAVDMDKDGELDDSENAARVEVTSYYPEALPGSHITMLSGSMDFFSFYGESFTQKGGSINKIFDVYPASKNATISQDAGCTLEYLTIKSQAETKNYTADTTCVINVKIGGCIKSIASSTAAANIKLISTADPGSGTFTFDNNSTFGTLDFSEYTLKHLDETNGYYTDIRYFKQNNPVKPQNPATLKIVADGDYYRYCPDTTTGAADIVKATPHNGGSFQSMLKLAYE